MKYLKIAKKILNELWDKCILLNAHEYDIYIMMHRKWDECYAVQRCIDLFVGLSTFICCWSFNNINNTLFMSFENISNSDMGTRQNAWNFLFISQMHIIFAKWNAEETNSVETKTSQRPHKMKHKQHFGLFKCINAEWTLTENKYPV